MFTENIQPACLHIDPNDLNSDVKLIVTGWVATSSEMNQPSNVLLKAQKQTVPIFECNSTFLEYNKLGGHRVFENGIDDGQYCAYDPHGTNDSCAGDSGGPIQFFDESNSGVATIVGIISFGISCGSEYPSIYTRVAHYLNWIETYVWPGKFMTTCKNKIH